MSRFTVRKILPVLWEVRDSRQHLVEWVLFGDLGTDHARQFMTWEFLADNPDARNEALRRLAEGATRAGIRHHFRPPPRLPRPY